MDMFFAAVEERRNPALLDVPFGVGGLGMLSTSNYVARLFGVRAGMPGYIGKRLCPELVIVPPSYGSYVDASEKVKGVLRRYEANLYLLQIVRNLPSVPRFSINVSILTFQYLL